MSHFPLPSTFLFGEFAVSPALEVSSSAPSGLPAGAVFLTGVSVDKHALHDSNIEIRKFPKDVAYFTKYQIIAITTCAWQ